MDDDVKRDPREVERFRRRSSAEEEVRPRIARPVVALLVLATLVWALLERIAPPGAFGG